MARVNVVIPQGGGVNRGIDPDLLPAPYSAVAENMLTRQAGGYQKMTGIFTDGISPSDAGLLLPDNERGLLFAGVLNGRKRGNDADHLWTTLGDTNMVFPTKVRQVGVLSLPGEISHETVCHNQGYTAVACRHRTRSAVGPSGGMQTVWAILDANDRIVGGPWTSTNVLEYPRIEPILIGGVPSFVFMGLADDIDGSLNPMAIVARRMVTSSLPAAGDLGITLAVGTLTPPGTAHALGRQLYDSHADYRHDSAYVTFYNGTNHVVVRTDGQSVIATTTVLVGAARATAVFHDYSVSTVYVYRTDGVAASIYYATNAIASFTAVAGAFVTLHPVFYTAIDAFYLFMDGMGITRTGVNPGVPSFSGAQSHIPNGKTFDPQDWKVQTHGDASASTAFFRHESGGTDAEGGTFRSLNDLSAHSWLDVSFLSTDDRSFTVVPIGQTRHRRVVFEGVTHNGASADLFVQPQSSRDTNGALFLPITFDTLAGRSLPIVDSGSGANDVGTVGPFETYAPNNDKLLGYVVVEKTQAKLEGTALPHQDSVVIAAGNVGMWDGEQYFDFLAPPKVLDYDDDSTSGISAGIARNTVNQINSYQLHGGTAGYGHIDWWAFCCVLVFTDKNGIEHRSAPSNIVTQNSITGVPSDGLPVIELGFDDSHQRILKIASATMEHAYFDVELYVTARDDGTPTPDGTIGAAAEADIVYEFYLAQRAPLHKQLIAGVDRYFTYDTLQSSFQGLEVTGFVSAPLFTDQNELAPVRPPASHVMAAAGNYLFLVPAETPWEIWPTKPLERGRGPEFAPELIIQGPPGGGDVVSLAGQGDRLIVLCERGVWELFVGGGGPDANGDGSFGQYRQLHAGDGCISHKGTVSTPNGALYLSRSGPKMVRPDGSVEDIGLPLLGVFTESGIRCSVYHEGAKEVWLGYGDGTAILNLRSNAWTTSTSIYSGLAYAAGEMYRRISSTGTIGYEGYVALTDTQSRYEPSSSQPILGKVVTPWLFMEDPSSWKRCVWVAIKASCLDGGAGTINVRFAYDFVNDDLETHTFTDAAFFLEPRRRIKPARQKFDAIRITVEEENTGSQPETSALLWALSSITLEVESKGGVVRLANTSTGHSFVQG